MFGLSSPSVDLRYHKLDIILLLLLFIFSLNVTECRICIKGNCSFFPKWLNVFNVDSNFENVGTGLPMLILEQNYWIQVGLKRQERTTSQCLSISKWGKKTLKD